MGSLGSVASSVAALPILELPVLEDVNSRQVWGGEGVGAGMFGLCGGCGVQASLGGVKVWVQAGLGCVEDVGCRQVWGGVKVWVQAGLGFIRVWVQAGLGGE